MSIATDYYDRPQYEGPDIVLLHDERRIARKLHSCSWCRRPIYPGDSYLSEAFTEDGKFKHEKVHELCRYGGED